MEFAIIKTGGKQYIVEPKKIIHIEKIDKKEGEAIIFDEVLMTGSEKGIKIGMPLVSGAKVAGKILKQDKEPKVITYKYRSKSRYHKKMGHRQRFSLVEITKITQ